MKWVLGFLPLATSSLLVANDLTLPISENDSDTNSVIQLAGLTLVHYGPRTPEAVAVPPKLENTAQEWPGRGLPWWEWTRLTGNWGGARSWLEEAGVTPAITYHFDGMHNIAGGVRRVTAGRGLLDLNVTMDLDPLLGLAGGTFFAQYFYRHGQNSAADVGDIHGFSNLDARRLSKLEELWYEQTLFGKKLRFKLGQVDANSEFDFVEAAGEFINATAGYSPTIAFMRTYPDPALSANAFFYPDEHWYVGAGFYGKPIGESDSHDPFLIGEAGYNFLNAEKESVGRVALGGWHQFGPVDRFDSETDSGACGLFCVAEVQVWREKGSDPETAQGVSLFGQYGYTDEAVSAAAHHVSLGGTWKGVLPSRDDDLAGIRFSCLKLSRAPGAGFDADEHDVECFYLVQLTPFLAIKPDLQWIHHTGGTRLAKDAWVASLRIRTDF